MTVSSRRAAPAPLPPQELLHLQSLLLCRRRSHRPPLAQRALLCLSNHLFGVQLHLLRLLWLPTPRLVGSLAPLRGLCVEGHRNVHEHSSSLVHSLDIKMNILAHKAPPAWPKTSCPAASSPSSSAISNSKIYGWHSLTLRTLRPHSSHCFMGAGIGCLQSNG